MIGRRCNAGNGISRPVLIARDLSVEGSALSVSQEVYCGGYGSVDPPLSIPNREVKRTNADGTAPPGGRVGSRRFSDSRTKRFARLSSFLAQPKTENGVCLPSALMRGGPLKLPRSPSAPKARASAYGIQPPPLRGAPCQGAQCRKAELPAPPFFLSPDKTTAACRLHSPPLRRTSGVAIHAAVQKSRPVS